MLRVNIKRIDKDLPLPLYETLGSVGFDLLVREDTLVPPKKIVLIPANVIVEVPFGYMLMLASRSSTPKKKGLTMPHGIGIIDHDYCGMEDEVRIQVYNFGEESVMVKRGEKIAQGVFVRIDRFSFNELDSLSKPTRGGFGSTDQK